MHATTAVALRRILIVDRSVQLVARNREYSERVNNVPCVVRSCIKMHATFEMNNALDG